MQSLGKYNLSCYASESQLQEYTSGKFREFLAKPWEEDDWPIRIAVKAVGLQRISEDDPTVEEIYISIGMQKCGFSMVALRSPIVEQPFLQQRVHSYGWEG